MVPVKKENVVVVRRANSKIIERYKANIGVRDDFIEFNVKGAKAQKIAEIAEVVKWLSVHDPTKSFQITQPDFEKAYGPGKRGTLYVKGYLKKFGIPEPRVFASQDLVHIWSRSAVK